MTKNRKILLSIFSGIVVALLVAFVGLNVFYASHIYPNTYIAGVDISNLDKSTAELKLTKSLSVPENFILQIDGQMQLIGLEPLNIELLSSSSVDNQLILQKDKNLFASSYDIVKSLFNPNKLPVAVSLDQERLKESVLIIAQTEVPSAVEPSVELVDGQIVINNGKPGRTLKPDQIVSEIITKLSLNETELTVLTELVDPTLTEPQIQEFKKYASDFIGSSIKLTADSFVDTLSDKQIVGLLSFDEKVNDEKLNELANEIDQYVSRPPQNPIFKLTNNRVTEFQPAKDGLVVLKDEFKSAVKNTLLNLPTLEDKIAEITVPVTVSPPDYNTDDVNDLGINSLLGVGDSSFKGSIPGRVHNVGLGASQFDGVLVAPDEVFSFNATIGDVSVFTGYKQAYIIQNGATILGDGGGVCQISTTLFRAALNAGLPIIERRSHSYRVSYYEQDSKPGYDATVFSPTTDFKFKNDTPGHLLIQTFFDPINLTLRFEIYGTDDGRVVSLTEPVITSSTPPPEDLYIDDPTKPTGYVQQIDYKAWGAKSQFNYKVIRDGEVLQDKVFYSVYQPWQAKFIRGTGSAT